jgi:hypothetical protein
VRFDNRFVHLRTPPGTRGQQQLPCLGLAEVSERGIGLLALTGILTRLPEVFHEAHWVLVRLEVPHCTTIDLDQGQRHAESNSVFASELGSASGHTRFERTGDGGQVMSILKQIAALWLSLPIMLALQVAGFAAVTPPNIESEKAQLATLLPAPWQLLEYNVEATANYGTDVEPEFRQRVTVTLVPSSDEFVLAGQSGPVTFLLPTVKAGEQRTLYLLVRSSLRAGSWSIDFDLPNQWLVDVGRPRDSYPGKTVIKGSPEEGAYWQAQKADADRSADEAHRDCTSGGVEPGAHAAAATAAS